MGIDFIFILKAIVIAIVEGITEFIPISSTGHMILIGELIRFNTAETKAFSDMFEVVIQLGAILAVIVLYWKKIYTTVIEFFVFAATRKEDAKRGFNFWLSVLIGTIPAIILGFTFNDFIEEKLFSAKTVSFAFVVGGILLVLVENYYRKNLRKSKRITKDIDKISFTQAIKVGIFQCLAMWPGMSRSASTIMGGWISGLSTSVATEFSFFLAIPAMIGASLLKLIKFDFSIMNTTYWLALAIGFLVAFLVALVVIEMFINFLKKKPMRVFAVYRIIVGLVLVGLAFAGIIK
ncbi:undecaprenyl-diphosphate phosphatase [Clostridium sp. 'White wine YQ']|uniref:undecaprenyl-diphosphate phosphatase n=1 Tax=Clostridium sp. 'White wine YQ' TaxID=3027474 RepID=UPI002365A4E2|nr:undecaprenyl-diphosphate phosphatase [Clostridium sp. 'White wine YQ']MDD7793214.1 undecaprenyl-diphosphate phosphatase [Clostridium sp. 'White wine YQ']